MEDTNDIDNVADVEEELVDGVDSYTAKGLYVVSAVTGSISLSEVSGSRSFVGKLGSLWNTSNNIAKDFVETIEGKFGRKNKLHAFFPANSLERAPVVFKKFTDADINFLGVCKELVRLIANEANSVGSGRLSEANVVFVHYKREADESELGKFLVVMVKHRGGFEFNQRLQPKRLKRIDVEDLLQAAAVDLNLFHAVYPKQDGSAYLHFIQGGQTSNFFKVAMGCSGAIPNKRSMEQLDKAIEEFICNEGISRALRRTLETAVEKYIDAVMSREDREARRVSLNDVVTAFEKALPVGHKSRGKLKDFVNSRGYEVSEVFEPTWQAVEKAKKVEISDLGANFKCTFSTEAVGYEGERKPIELATDLEYVKIYLNDAAKQILLNSVGAHEPED